MEKVIEKLKTDNEGLKLVVDELIKQCGKEPAFIEKILSEKKSLDDCWKYIKSRASKERQDNCAMISKETVYGWSIHYFDEEELEDWQPVEAKVTTSPKKSKPEESDDDDFDDEDQDEIEKRPAVETKPKPIKKQKGVAEGQISLFDF